MNGDEKDYERDADPLLSDNLAEVLSTFPNDALCSLVAILKQHSSWSPFPGRRAYEAHALPDDADFTRHANAIADEILWWGTNEFNRLFGYETTWHEVVAGTAAKMKVSQDQGKERLPAWKIEGAILLKGLDNWERMSPDERKEALRKAGWNLDALRGVGAGVIANLGGRQLLQFVAARALIALPGAALPLVAAALGIGGIGWTAYDLAGPSYRVLRFCVLAIALTRRRLRDERAAAAFEV
jgi:uncharacterized protein YaaW (UPF0174 family)